MSGVYLIGTDIGTQGTKTVIVDGEGNVISTGFQEYDVIKPKPSWAEQWPETWINATFNTIRIAIEKSSIDPRSIAGIALSGLYGGSGVPVDKNMNPLRPCLIWMDRRAVAEVEWVKKHIDKDTLFSITGNYVDSYYGFTKMLWIKNNEPDVWKKIYKFLTPKDYVIWKMTGINAIDYSSAGNIGGIFDIHRRTWSEEMSKALGIPLSMLPENIVPSSSIVGHVNRVTSEKTGLLEGTPVISGGIDAPMASLSAAVLDDKKHVAMTGTSICWGVVHKGTHLSPKLVSFPYVVKEKEMVYTFGGAATAGGIVKWFRDNFALKERETERSMGISAYKQLDEQAKDIPVGSEGLLLLPYFMGERSPIWDPNAKGTIIGLTLYHTKAHVFRAILEGVAYSLRHNMETGIEAGMELDEECIIVGGVANSKLWVQIFADVTGFPMKTTTSQVEAPYGDAFLAGLGSGVIESPEKIKEWVEFTQPIKPNLANKRIYDNYYNEYINTYPKLKDTMHVLGNIGQLR